MNTPHDIGKAITQNFKFASRVGAECESLAKVIKEELSVMLKNTDIPKGYKAKGEWDEDGAGADDGWIYIGATYSLPMAYKYQKIADKHLCFQISLTGDGIEAEGNDEPLIHITWSEASMSFQDDGWYMSFPCKWIKNNEVLSIDTDCLLRSLSPDGTSDYGWIYSLRLTDINSQQDIQKNIIEPVKALLLNKSAAEALSGTKAVRYQKVEGEPGQFRALPR